jgi:glycosyltransferase involved in cell wall biosynthesis
MSTHPGFGAGAKVSIVIPAYNHGRYVAEAIDSVLAQDYPFIELIVVDDGSTDNTREVLATYAGRAHVTSQANAGQAATINLGWAKAGGDVVSYLSADDRLEPRAVSRAVGALNAHPDAVMAYGDYNLIDPESAFVRCVTAPAFDYSEMVRDLVCAPGPGVFLRRCAVDRLDGWNTEWRQAPDFDYWLRLALLGPFVKVPQVLAGLRVHPGSASYATTTPARADEPVRIMETYFTRTDLPEDTRVLQRRSLSSAHLLAARAHLRARRFGSAARSVRRAGALSPATVMSPRAARLLANALVNRAGHQLLWYFRRVRVQDKAT